MKALPAKLRHDSLSARAEPTRSTFGEIGRAEPGTGRNQTAVTG
ncbi:hypothetical protein [Synechocystis sp. PCC 7509]|nr:hypothetical protein [Synechocystis sp. PCC 7509]